MSEVNIQDIGSELEAGLDPEMFDKGYELTMDPQTRVTFGGMNHPTGEWRSPHVSVYLKDQETIQWFRERDLLSYIDFYEGDSQIVTDSSFVIGSLLAAAQLRQAKQSHATVATH